MDPKAIELQIKNNFVKQAKLMKRSKFLKEWRDRWVVLTVNFLFTFKTNQYKDPTEVLDLRHIQSIKSYFKRTHQDYCPNGFKISSDELTLYFRCREVTQKWGWIVALERALDFKFSGETQYNLRKDLQNKGLDPLQEANTPGKIEDPYPDTIRKKSLSTQDASFQDKNQYMKSQEQLALYKEEPKRQSRMTSTSFIDAKYTTVSTQTSDNDQVGAVSKSPSKQQPKLLKKRRLDVREAYQDDLGLRRSRMARSLFDQLKLASSLKVKRTFFEIISRLLVATDAILARFTMLQVKAHEVKDMYLDLLIENNIKQISSEKTATDALLILKALSPDFIDLFSETQLQSIKQFIIKCLQTFKKDSILMLNVEVLSLLHSSSKFSEDQLKQVARILHVILKTNKSTQLLDYIKSIQL